MASRRDPRAQRVQVRLVRDRVLVVREPGRRRTRAARAAPCRGPTGCARPSPGSASAAGRAAAGGSSRSPWPGSRAAARRRSSRRQAAAAVDVGRAAGHEREDGRALDRVEAGVVRSVSTYGEKSPPWTAYAGRLRSRPELARDSIAAVTAVIPTMRVPPAIVTRVGSAGMPYAPAGIGLRKVTRRIGWSAGSTSTKSMPFRSTAAGTAPGRGRAGARRRRRPGTDGVAHACPSNCSTRRSPLTRDR